MTAIAAALIVWGLAVAWICLASHAPRRARRRRPGG